MDPEAARRQLQKYMSTFRGRALLGPLPLPPAKAGSSGAGVAQVRAAALDGYTQTHRRSALPASAETPCQGHLADAVHLHRHSQPASQLSGARPFCLLLHTNGRYIVAMNL